MALVKFEQFVMTDEEWSRITSYYDLPVEERGVINWLIAHYRLAKGLTSNNPKEVKEKLQQAANLAKKLSDAIADFGVEEHCALFSASEPPIARRYDENVVNSFFEATIKVAQLHTWLNLATARFGPMPTRSAFPELLLMQNLDSVLGRNGQRLSWTNNDGKKANARELAREVLRIANPKISEGSIDEAIKAAIANRYKAPI